jgi:hypothetical protein
MSKAAEALEPADAGLQPDEVDSLPDNQRKALAALLTSRTHKEAAGKCGLSESTLWRYLRDSAFAEHYRAARRVVVDQAVYTLQAEAADAAAVLREVSQDKQAPAAARVAAARVIVGLAFKGLELGDLQERIVSLEEYIKRKAEEDDLQRGKGDDEEDEEG